jgi:peptidoglycan/LPS O-acetylase OafA/YrhL
MVFHVVERAVDAPRLLPGGFLGVDLFFVLSGFLITTLLGEEWQRRGHHVAVGAFYARRALRLFPALALVLIAVLVYAAVAAPANEVGPMRHEAIWTALYAQNWQSIYEPTFGLHLSHAWSLSIEEQFYLVWPFLLLVILHVRDPRRRVALVLGGAAASALAMVVLYADHIGPEPERLYFGTDTRAQSLLLGSALALAFSAGLLRRLVAAPRLVAAFGWASVVAVVVMWRAVDGFEDSFLYRGGFTLVAIAGTTIVLALVAAPNGVMARLLAFPMLRDIGRISYGLYLWHWPIFLVVDADRTGLSFWPLAAARFALTFAFAVVSYLAVERPFLRLKRRFERVPAALAGGEMPGVTVRP